MDRTLIHELASILGSRMDNPGAQNIRLQCPLAPRTHAGGTDNTPAWSILVDPHNPSRTKCWACDEAGTVEEILERGIEMGIPGLEEALLFAKENDAGGLAGAFTGLAIQRRRSFGGFKKRSGFDVERYVRQCSRLTARYLIDRGLVAYDLKRWQIGYDDGPTKIGHTTIHHRAVFPVWDERGTLVGATMRTVLPEGVDPPKYRDTPMLPKGDIFYGENFIDRTRGVVHIVEGILDAVVASRYLPNVVAILGANTGMGPTRVEKLRKWCNRVVLILDPDTAGSEAVSGKWKEWKGRDGKTRKKFIPGIRHLLSQYFVTKVVTLPVGKDPADVGVEIVHYVNAADYLKG